MKNAHRENNTSQTCVAPTQTLASIYQPQIYTNTMLHKPPSRPVCRVSFASHPPKTTAATPTPAAPAHSCGASLQYIAGPGRLTGVAERIYIWSLLTHDIGRRPEPMALCGSLPMSWPILPSNWRIDDICSCTERARGRHPHAVGALRAPLSPILGPARTCDHCSHCRGGACLVAGANKRGTWTWTYAKKNHMGTGDWGDLKMF